MRADEVHVLVQADLACARSFTERLGCIDYDCGCRKMIESGDYFLCTYHQGKDDGAWSIDPEQASMTGGVLSGDDVQRTVALIRGGELTDHVVHEIIRGCGWLNVRPRADGRTEYHYDGVMVLKGDAATYLNWVIEKVGDEK